MTNKFSAILLASALATTAMAQRATTDLRAWDFSHDGKAWQSVNVPHDWAISGPFNENIDVQYAPIIQNGETTESKHTGRSGALPWIGQGEYRTTFNCTDDSKRTELFFDGAMAEPQVFINGKLAGEWKYGYNAFRIDITPYVKKGRNDILVKLNNREESNRWYPGAGLYRPVSLVVTSKTCIDTWETFFKTNSIVGNTAEASLNLGVKDAAKAKRLKATVELLSPEGKTAFSRSVAIDRTGKANVDISLADAKAWSPETPALYTLRISLYEGKKLIDNTTQKVGLRTISIDNEKGFCLNGSPRKFKGVCLHHDLGPIGAAVNKAAIIRQIRILKDMGADAIRTSHNMPSAMQMEVCDSMGMMVMAESFDAWKYPKVKNGYNLYYDNWWKKDIENLIRNHRNHPSIVMWSIGNEIPEQGGADGAAMAKQMVDFCHSLDPTRTVTCGSDRVEDAVKSGFLNALDVPGLNYRVPLYEKALAGTRHGFILGSETASTVSSRGEYFFADSTAANAPLLTDGPLGKCESRPVVFNHTQMHKNGQCNGYDSEYCWWSNLPDDDFRMQDDFSWTIGQFVWTGFDYLGEPTPYDGQWPARSSYFGICDLAGLPKDRFYLYRSQWNKTSHTLHILPHWTWPEREGLVTPVYAYTDMPSAELFVNGKSQGRISKDKNSRLDRYRLRWNNVVYQPGEITVVAYDDKGNETMRQTVKTASKPAAIAFEADRNSIKADGNDLAFITISLTDKDGNFCPREASNLTFTVTGQGSFKGACNGDATSLQVFTKPEMRLFNGKLVVVVQSSTTPGKITLTATDSENRLQGSYTITTEK